MADNVGITTGSDATVAADDIGGVLYQRVKVAVGADGAASDLAPGQATMANSLPVTIASNQSALPVTDNSGSLTVDSAQLPAALAAGGGLKIEGVAGGVVVPVSDGAGSLTVDVGAALPAGTNAIGKLAANSGVDIGDVDVLSVTPGTGATNLGKAEDAGHSSGDVGMMALAVRKDTAAALAGSDADYAPLEVDANGRLHVIASAGVAGDVAHDSADSGNPLKIGAKAVNAEPTAVAADDRANLITDLVGKLITLPYANPENFLSGKTAAITDTTRTAVIAAQGAGVRIYVTHLIVTNSHASVGTYVKIEDDTTEIYGGYAAPAGGGFSITLPVPLRLTANKALNVSCGTTGANVYASASGYKGA